MCFNMRSSRYVLLAWMADWNGRASFLMATLVFLCVSTAELQQNIKTHHNYPNILHNSQGMLCMQFWMKYNQIILHALLQGSYRNPYFTLSYRSAAWVECHRYWCFSCCNCILKFLTNSQRQPQKYTLIIVIGLYLFKLSIFHITFHRK